VTTAGMRPPRALLAVLLAGLLSLLVGCTATAPVTDPATGGNASVAADQSGGVDPESGLPWIAEQDLPPQGRDTLHLIDRGGPFPYDKDGSVFGNREGLLPDADRGYYREYTVPTPGESDRGARRIVTGSQGEYYWTADHYESFSRIRRVT